MKEYEKVLNFWFDPNHIPLHFAVNREFDKKIEKLFLKTWEKACKGLLYSWRENIHGRLGEIIVLDQFSRNLWRDSNKSFTQDKMAVILAQEAVFHKDYFTLSELEKRFVIMPFMHSEEVEIHERFRPYFEALEEKSTLEFEKKHYQVLKKWGRYPTRNKIMGRKSTEEEEKLLKEHNHELW